MLLVSFWVVMVVVVFDVVGWCLTSWGGDGRGKVRGSKARGWWRLLYVPR